MEKNAISIILPSYKPDDKLISTVDGLIKAGFDDIIVVDDGSGAEFNSYFDSVREMVGVTVLVHSENRGKGAALKTAFNWYMFNRSGKGVITVDGDGQHRTQDIIACGERLLKTGDIVLGARDFKAAGVPARSRFGNNFSSLVFRLFVGMKLSDTQTGLRAIPARHLEFMCSVKGDRYEYETNMLLHMKKQGLDYSEVKIETVYIDENETSHFRPIVDSMRIYSLIFKFVLRSPFMLFFGSSMICYFFDYLMFIGFNHYIAKIAEGMIVTVAAYGGARMLSSLLNFYLNRLIFKKQGGSVGSTMIKYYLLVAFNLLLGSIAVYLISSGLLQIATIREFGLSINAESPSAVIEPIVKIPVDGLLYILSYTVQKHIVFKKEENEDER